MIQVGVGLSIMAFLPIFLVRSHEMTIKKRGAVHVHGGRGFRPINTSSPEVSWATGWFRRAETSGGCCGSS